MDDHSNKTDNSEAYSTNHAKIAQLSNKYALFSKMIGISRPRPTNLSHKSRNKDNQTSEKMEDDEPKDDENHKEAFFTPVSLADIGMYS